MDLYITGGCNKDMMYGLESNEKNMGQYNTVYKALNIAKGWDIIQFKENIYKEILEYK